MVGWLARKRRHLWDKCVSACVCVCVCVYASMCVPIVHAYVLAQIKQGTHAVHSSLHTALRKIHVSNMLRWKLAIIFSITQTSDQTIHPDIHTYYTSKTIIQIIKCIGYILHTYILYTHACISNNRMCNVLSTLSLTTVMVELASQQNCCTNSAIL